MDIRLNPLLFNRLRRWRWFAAGRLAFCMVGKRKILLSQKETVMIRKIIVGISLSIIFAWLIMAGCEKEKIVESTEYIHDIEYIQLPPDTVLKIDTVYLSDSVTIYDIDTMYIFDTVVQVNYIYDTAHIYDTVHIYETVYIHDTVHIYDTVTTVVHHYDTTVVTDTVTVSQCDPNEYLAMTALHYYSDVAVIEYIYQAYGYDDGWVFYLSSFQVDLTKQSASVYDIYGYIDYWTPDWSGYLPLEFFWRMTYTGGDPADPNNWQMTDPPTSAPEHEPGLRTIPGSTLTQSSRR